MGGRGSPAFFSAGGNTRKEVGMDSAKKYDALIGLKFVRLQIEWCSTTISTVTTAEVPPETTVTLKRSSLV